MDSVTSTEDLVADIKWTQENVLLDIIKELCSESKLTSKLKGKVNRIIADCDLTHYSGLHKLNSADENTSSLLGFMHQTSEDLTFEEQSELNQAIIQKIETKLPVFISDLEKLKRSALNGESSRSDKIKELRQSLDEKLTTLEEQESEKVELMMEWLNHRLHNVTKFNDNSSELLTLKITILELKSKILHLKILQSIFTETNQSIKAYSEIHKDLKDSIKETEERIKTYKNIIQSDYK